MRVRIEEMDRNYYTYNVATYLPMFLDVTCNLPIYLLLSLPILALCLWTHAQSIEKVQWLLVLHIIFFLLPLPTMTSEYVKWEKRRPGWGCWFFYDGNDKAHCKSLAPTGRALMVVDTIDGYDSVNRKLETIKSSLILISQFHYVSDMIELFY